MTNLHHALRIGREAGLRYVYLGNVPDVGGESTACHACGQLVVERVGVHLVANRIRDGRCPYCDTAIPDVGMDGPP